MLRTLCDIFGAQGHSVTAIVAKSIRKEAQYLGADKLAFIDGEPGRETAKIGPEYDGVFIVAPESHGILSKLTASVAAKFRLLSCPPETVDVLSDKNKSMALVSRTAKEIRVPEYIPTEADPRRIAAAIKTVGFPAVLKPPDGAGCSGTSIVRTQSGARKACARLTAGGWKEGIIQKFVQGRHLSATFIARRSGITPLSINTQSMALSESIEYVGGSCPYPLPAQDSVWNDLSRIVRENSFEGLMSMDFVFDGEDIHFMEINPRMTTSCIGLSRVIEPPLGNLLTDTSKQVSQYSGYAQWVILPILRTLQVPEDLLPKLFEFPSLVSPPFPLGPFYLKGSSKILACAWGRDSLETPGKIDETKNWLAGLHLHC